MSESIRALAYVQSEIKKYRQEQVAFLAASRADSFDEYKKICGVIRGLDYAENVIEDLVRKVDEDA